MSSTGRRLSGKTALITAAAQGIGRAQLAAVEQVLVSKQGPVRIRVDNQWVVDGMQVLLSGLRPDPLWEHGDLWYRVWFQLQRRQAYSESCPSAAESPQ